MNRSAPRLPQTNPVLAHASQTSAQNGLHASLHAAQTPFARGRGISDPFAEPSSARNQPNVSIPSKIVANGTGLSEYRVPSMPYAQHRWTLNSRGQAVRQVPVVINIPENRVEDIIQALSSPMKTSTPPSLSSSSLENGSSCAHTAPLRQANAEDSLEILNTRTPTKATEIDKTSDKASQNLRAEIPGTRKTSGNSDTTMGPPSSAVSSYRQNKDVDMEIQSPLNQRSVESIDTADEGEFLHYLQPD